MPPKKVVEFTVYIIDCINDTDDRFDYFHKIYSTKFFMLTKTSIDMQRVILLNSSKVNSIEGVNNWSLYELDKINIFKDKFKEFEKTVDSANKDPNIPLKAIHAAIKTFREIEDKKNIIIKRIVFLTDLTTSIGNDKGKMEYISRNLNIENIILYIIGVPNVIIPKVTTRSDICKLLSLDYITNIQPINDAQKSNFMFLQKISQNNILIIDKECGFDILFSFKSKMKDPYKWYVNLNIGKDLGIPIAFFRTTRQHQTIKYCPALKSDENLDGFEPVKAWFDLNTHEEVPPEDVVPGYYNHGKFVTLCSDKTKGTRENKFEKCLSVFGFVDAKEIQKDLYFLPNSMGIIKADMRSAYASDKSFKLFVTGLRSKNVVAIAKRVYNRGNKPNIFAIFPCPEHPNGNYLLMAQLPYAHQFKERFVQQPSSKVETDDQELKMFTCGLLDAMTADFYDNGQPMNPLPESLKLSRNLVLQYNYFGNLNLGSSQKDETEEMSPNPTLVKRAEEYADMLFNKIN